MEDSKLRVDDVAEPTPAPDRVAELVVPFLRERVGKATNAQQPTTTRRFE
jgi:hypothetical protein